MRRVTLVFLAAIPFLLALEPPTHKRPSLWPRPSPEPTIQHKTAERPFYQQSDRWRLECRRSW